MNIETQSIVIHTHIILREQVKACSKLRKDEGCRDSEVAIL